MWLLKELGEMAQSAVADRMSADLPERGRTKVVTVSTGRIEVLLGSSSMETKVTGLRSVA